MSSTETQRHIDLQYYRRTPLLQGNCRSDSRHFSQMEARQTLAFSVSGCMLALSCIAFCCMTGCSTDSNDVKRYKIEGEVNFGGQPVPHGTITLEPDSEKGNKGPMSTGVIENSKFSIPSERGIVGGPYRIRITGYRSGTDTSGADVNYGTPLFSNHEIKTELPTKSSSQKFDIPATKK